MIECVDAAVLQACNPTLSANEELKRIVESAKLHPAVALTIFNRGLGPQALSESQWKALLAEPGSTTFKPLPPELLEHAHSQFAQIG